MYLSNPKKKRFPPLCAGADNTVVLNSVATNLSVSALRSTALLSLSVNTPIARAVVRNGSSYTPNGTITSVSNVSTKYYGVDRDTHWLLGMIPSERLQELPLHT